MNTANTQTTVCEIKDIINQIPDKFDNNNHDYSDPFCLSGGVRIIRDTVVATIQTSNPTTQEGEGQLFVQKSVFTGRKPFNKVVADTLRNLANSIENHWENTENDDATQSQ